MARTKAHYSVKVRDLINGGILKPGEEAVLEPRRGEVYRGRIGKNGELIFEGRSFSSPSKAAQTFAGNSRNGWRDVLVRGQSLEYWRDQFTGGAPPASSSPVVLATPPAPAPASAPVPSPSLKSASLTELIEEHVRGVMDGLASKMADLSADQFEELVAEFLRRLGYADVRRVGGPGDRNIDVTGSYPAPFVKVPVRVQVKHRRSGPNIGPTDVAAFRDRAGGPDHALLMATNVEFTEGAKETASEQGRQVVHLVDGKQLINSMVEKGIGVRDGLMGLLEIDEVFWRGINTPA